MNNTEIEVRFLNVDKENLVTKLYAVGARDKGEMLLSEVIFYDPALVWLQESRFVRVRTLGATTTLTYKKNKRQTIDSAYEVEFPVPDQEQAVKFLEGIGLVAYRHQEKKRHTFLLGKVVVDIDSWPLIPPYVELEGPSPAGLREVAELLGFNWNEGVFEDAKVIIENRYHIPIGNMRRFTFGEQDQEKSSAPVTVPRM